MWGIVCAEWILSEFNLAPPTPSLFGGHEFHFEYNNRPHSSNGGAGRQALLLPLLSHLIHDLMFDIFAEGLKN